MTGGSNWQYLSPNGLPQPGSPTVGGGGSPTAQNPRTLAGYRSILDAVRSAAAPQRTPQAEYPDGYLGNVNSRREDRLLGHIQNRLTQRSYQRGVHKGERVDPQDYYWNDTVNPQAGIVAEARGQKWSQIGSTPMDQINHMGKNHLLAPSAFDSVANHVGLDAPKETDPIKQQRMQRLLPRWK